MTRIVVTRRPPGSAVERLEDAGTVWTWPEDRAMPRDRLLEETHEADGLLCMLTDSIDAEVLDAAPRLRTISTMAVGTDNIDLAGCTRKGIAVGHTPDVLTEATADMAFALLLTAARRVVEGADYVKAGRWQRWEPTLLLGAQVHATTLGIIGLGRIGTAVAKRAVGFEMQIRYSSRSRRLETETALGVEHRTLEALLEEADHVLVACPLATETHHLIGMNAFRRMKPTATLTNIARGAIVDPRALEWALRTGEIAAAALDVTDPEPIPPDDPLLTLSNCVVVPHLGSATVATRVAMADLAAENLIAGLRGDPMPACANPEVYRPQQRR
ncbi:MAG TPA: D-glycerate dehydrogenase [Actinobacteria bacterium]|nr:glyoxylate/hydroxypyruvate reductase B [bacterium BMS3Bbin01]HDH25768.1 D-glycerate dehydrogenase [Actinomycetota bacterium]HDK45088.1 D-glycerate dehydrogenase [Actinomycetota bacterium]